MSQEILTGRQTLIRAVKKNENDWTRVFTELRAKVDVSSIEDKKSCCSAGNNEVDEQAGITQYDRPVCYLGLAST